MAVDSCCFVNSFESACVGPPALPLLDVVLEGELDNFPSDGGKELSGAATEPVAPLIVGLGGASAFLQPINSIASKAETRMEGVKGISTSYG